MCSTTVEKTVAVAFIPSLRPWVCEPCGPHARVYHLITGPTLSWVSRPFFWAPDQHSGFQKICTQYDQNWNCCTAPNLLLCCVPFVSDLSHLSQDFGSHSWLLPTPHPPSSSRNWAQFSKPARPAHIYLYLSASPAPTPAPESGCHT